MRVLKAVESCEGRNRWNENNKAGACWSFHRLNWAFPCTWRCLEIDKRIYFRHSRLSKLKFLCFALKPLKNIFLILLRWSLECLCETGRWTRLNFWHSHPTTNLSRNAARCGEVCSMGKKLFRAFAWTRFSAWSEVGAEGKKDLTHGFCIKPGEGCSGMNGRWWWMRDVGNGPVINNESVMMQNSRWMFNDGSARPLAKSYD